MFDSRARGVLPDVVFQEGYRLVDIVVPERLPDHVAGAREARELAVRDGNGKSIHDD